ncbi:UDP-N-acetylmuramate dehydrogenase [Candidatus Parcubacteria bacterium]|nr:UDP-N-acetylmuramate dehydrogenase [Candidatus Parcubacteria bacterium]
MKIKDLPGIKENISMAEYTTFKIGGPAKYFFVAKNPKALVQAIKVAKKNHLPFFIFGGGSNLLVSDRGYKGLVIKIQNSKLKIKNHNSRLETIYAEAGAILSSVVVFSVKKSLRGLEWAVGIPGTLGAAAYGNVGAFGSTMAEIIKSVEILDANNLKISDLSKKECRFGEKNSIFKRNKNLIILSVILELQKGGKKEIEGKIKKFQFYRKGKQPLIFPSAGCIFKNPKGFSAGELIDKCGLKGKKIDGAQISEKHANFIVNLGGAKAKDVVKLIKIIKQKVKSKFKIELEEEIQYLGF